jgi:hypothetical protein
MPGKNWNSKTRTWSDVVRPETKARAACAQVLRNAGVSVATIAEAFDLTPSRIYELLKN